MPLIFGSWQEAAMDHAAYHILYVDNRANDDLDGKYIHKTRFVPLVGADW